MTNSEIVQANNDALIVKGNIEDFASYFSEDFTFSGPVPEPINGPAYAGMMGIMKTAFSDFNNNMEINGEDGDEVYVTFQLAGKHSGDLDLSPMGMPVIPATNKSFRLPKEKCVCTVQNGKITSMKVDVPKGGGLMGILTQLGIEMPG